MTISFGFVGLSAGYSWAGLSHLPGLRLIKNGPYKITAVVNTSVESAKKLKRTIWKVQMLTSLLMIWFKIKMSMLLLFPLSLQVG
jgi:hypothetical protein